MNIIGISGGFDSILEGKAGAFDLTENTRNDSAAVLLRDGEVLFAVEEERLNRIPRTNYRPVLAIERCLQAANLSLREIDKIVVYGEEKFYNFFLQRNYLANPNRYTVYATIREWIRNYLKETFNYAFDAKSIVFVKHQYAHAMSAYACSGFESALVLSLDKSEDGFSGLLPRAAGWIWKRFNPSMTQIRWSPFAGISGNVWSRQFRIQANYTGLLLQATRLSTVRLSLPPTNCCRVEATS